ncbi:MAG: S-methyl-5-thioribose-1-phosphate isomerase [Gammaproteobacteria bacterium]|nr:S-methyl-5-thioribose-1-phosphate isomerase [Gammaproteobacteria bacterium]
MSTYGHDSVRAIKWREDVLNLLDQRLLPSQTEWLVIDSAAGAADAIRTMVVRGAPAIGITAAYGVVLGARRRYTENPSTWRNAIEADLQLLAASRPTAVNLFWALKEMRQAIETFAGDADPVPELLALAHRISEEDIEGNRRMGDFGADLIEGPCAVLTHCNAGALATGGYGTALGVIRSAYARGLIDTVFADETRPWLQGARLTAWELIEDGIPVTLVAEGSASYLMAQGKVKWIIVGADRIAANGDVANKIGTFNLGVIARHHGVKLMVAAPTSTIDLETPTGRDIPIEQRTSDELLTIGGQRIAAAGASAWNPVFDVTPAELVTAIVTERGVIREPNAERVAALMRST